MSKERQQPKKADSHFASNRTQELMHQIALFREARGLTPIMEPVPYRRPELRRQMEPGRSYEI